MPISEEELAIAKATDLTLVAGQLGYTVVRKGTYHSLKEIDSMRIYNCCSWYRWSQNKGGSQIDFLQEFAGFGFKEAVIWLLEFSGYHYQYHHFSSALNKEQYLRVQSSIDVELQKKSVPFQLPEKAENFKRLYAYLMKTRGLSKQTVDYFVKKALIYESQKHHNIVFLGNDKDGITRFASMRGTSDYLGTPFKGDVKGNDKNYGFHVLNSKSETLLVFESAIDLMSYVDFYHDYSTSKLALGMVNDRPLERFLEEHPQIKRIGFALDNDEPGRKAVKELMEKYEAAGYAVKDIRPPEGSKDWNQYLTELKGLKSMEIQQQSSQLADKCRTGFPQQSKQMAR